MVLVEWICQRAQLSRKTKDAPRCRDSLVVMGLKPIVAGTPAIGMTQLIVGIFE